MSFTRGIEALESMPRRGHDDAAITIARRLLAQAEAGLPAEAALAQSVNFVGVVFSNRAFHDEARRAFTLALDLLQRSTPGDNALLASLNNNLGQLDQRDGELEAAQHHLETSLALWSAPGTRLTAERAFAADNLAAVLSQRGQHDRAEPLHLEALKWLQGLGPQRGADVATVHGNLGLLYRRRGELARAQASLLRSVDAHLRLEPLASGGAQIPLVNLIDVLLQRGQPRQAEELVGWLLQLGGDHAGAAQQSVATSLLQLGSSAFAQGQLGLTERIATRAITLFEATVGPSAPQTLRAVRLLANVHAEKGNADNAESGLLRVLDAPGTTPQHTASLLVDLGKSLRRHGLGSHPAAIAMFERAIGLLNPLGGGHPQLLASALGNLAFTCFEADDAPRADALYLQALALGDARSLGGEYPWLLYSHALLHYHLGQHDAARDGMQHALRLWSRRHGRSHPHVATALANLALVHWARGDIGAAQRALARSQAMRASGFQRVLLVGTERERLEAAQDQQGDLYKLVTFCFAAGARGAVARTAAELLLQRKACVLDALALTHARIRDRMDDASRVRLDRLAELRRLIAEQALSAQLFGDLSDPRQLAALQAEEDGLQTQLSHAGALGSGVGVGVGVGVGDPAEVNLAAVQAALPEGALLVEYLRWPVFEPLRSGRGTPWRGARYAAMLLRGRGAPHWFDLGDAGVIDRAVDDLRALLCNPDSDTDAAHAAAADMYRHLVAPFEPLLPRVALLLVAPDGALNLLPFGVLGALGAPMLAERCVVCHLTSGRELLRPALPLVPDAVVQVVVDADFDADDLPGVLGGVPDAPAAAAAPASDPPRAPMQRAPQLDALPRTRDEAQLIKALLPRCRVLAGAQASVAALKAITQPALLHIATHGWFRPVEATPPLLKNHRLQIGGESLLLGRAAASAQANPMLHAGLALAGANRSAPGLNWGFVTAAELAALDLRGTELVVLSACDTGLGAIVPGGEFAGLRRAFSMAGAAAQVISLWSVDDEATAALMQSFYRHLLAGAGRADALQRAQRDVRRRPRWAHPSAWAAFVCWGAAGPLSDGLRAGALELPP